MKNCYLCSDCFTDINSSKEHILLNAIGGFLKSKELLCKDCNSKFGETADAELARQLSFLSSFLQVKRDKGENQPIKGGRTKDGKEYHLIDGSKPVLSKPEFKKIEDDGKIQLSLSARSEKEMEAMLEGIKRKHPDFDNESAKKQFKWKEEYLDEPLSYNIMVGGDLAFKSLVKTALNYYIFSQNEKTQVDHLFDYLKGNSELKVCNHYNHKKNVYRKEPGEIIHLIQLVGNKNSKLLYCYIELFSAYSFIVLLSDNYTGKNIESTYAYNLITSKVVEKGVTLKLKKEQFDINSLIEEDSFKIITEKLSRVMKIANKIHTKKEISRISEAAVDKILEKHKDEKVFTEEMIGELSQEVAEKYVRFAYRGTKKDGLIDGL